MTNETPSPRGGRDLEREGAVISDNSISDGGRRERPQSGGRGGVGRLGHDAGSAFSKSMSSSGLRVCVHVCVCACVCVRECVLPCLVFVRVCFERECTVRSLCCCAILARSLPGVSLSLSNEHVHTTYRWIFSQKFFPKFKHQRF